jgi:hypothetical protein
VGGQGRFYYFTRIYHSRRAEFSTLFSNGEEATRGMKYGLSATERVRELLSHIHHEATQTKSRAAKWKVILPLRRS